MIIRTLAYVCDKCKKGVSMIRPQDILNLPPGWVHEVPSFGYNNDYEKHTCDECIEKKEIKETFK